MAQWFSLSSQLVRKGFLNFVIYCCKLVPGETLHFGVYVYSVPEGQEWRQQRLNIYAYRKFVFKLWTAYNFICLIILIKLYPNYNLLSLGATVKSTRAYNTWKKKKKKALRWNRPCYRRLISIKLYLCKCARARPIRPASLLRLICNRGRRSDVTGAKLAQCRLSVILIRD